MPLESSTVTHRMASRLGLGAFDPACSEVRQHAHDGAVARPGLLARRYNELDALAWPNGLDFSAAWLH